jgi:glycosyltransferase involved in cell wall biosynthesis
LIKVALINNVIPTYREDFIRRIINSNDIDLKIYVCEKINFLKIKTIHTKFPNHVYITKNKSFRKWNILFQNIPFFKILINSHIIIVDGNPRHISIFLSSFFFKLLGKKIIIWSCAYSYENHNKISEKIRLFLWRYFKYFFLYTEKDIQYINSLKFSYKYAISLNNGLDQDNINKEKINWSNENLLEWQNKNSILNKRIILSCSRLEKGRYDDLIKILPALFTKYEDLVWCIIGDGDAKDEIVEFIKINNIENKVKLCGAIYEEKKPCPLVS